MKRLALVCALLLLTGCTAARRVVQEPVRDPAPPTAPPAAPVKTAPEDARPDLRWQSFRDLSRDELREGLLRLMNEEGTDPVAQLERLFAGAPRTSRTDTVPWVEADLDGNGEKEFVLALGVTDQERYSTRWQGAALFVIYRSADGRFAVDRSDRLPDKAEIEMMQPSLHGVADLAGLGRPQIIWSRPHMIATGPQPFSVLVTSWEPGRFTHLRGEMVISRTKDWSVTVEGQDLLLTGGSRSAMFVGERTDRYRFVDGAFRLIDRRFTTPGETGYDRFWNGLVAESVGRVADAEQEYRMILEPDRPAHSGHVPQYKNVPKELTSAELEAFDQALRAFARFRLGGLLLQVGRADEAREILRQADGSFAELPKIMLEAETREAGCRVAADWAAAEPEFLKAWSAGVADGPWKPEILCTHVEIDDQIHWQAEQ